MSRPFSLSQHRPSLILPRQADDSDDHQQQLAQGYDCLRVHELLLSDAAQDMTEHHRAFYHSKPCAVVGSPHPASRPRSRPGGREPRQGSRGGAATGEAPRPFIARVFGRGGAAAPCGARPRKRLASLARPPAALPDRAYLALHGLLDGVHPVELLGYLPQRLPRPERLCVAAAGVEAAHELVEV